MDNLVEEVRQWNTPVLGAFLLWRFTTGYCERHPAGDGPVILLHFLASAILTNQKLCEPISKRRDNLQSYVRSFEQDGVTDLLMGIQERVENHRDYTLASIDIATANGILVWDTSQAKLYPRKIERKPNRGCGPRATTVRLGEQAELLGNWLSEHELGAIASYMGVAF